MKWLVVATVAVSILVPLSGQFGATIERLVAFNPDGLREWRIWTLATYTFLNPDPFMLIFAGLGLWMMGGSLEAMWGTRRFLTFYFASSILAALATAAVGIFSSAVAVTSRTASALNSGLNRRCFRRPIVDSFSALCAKKVSTQTDHGHCFL